MTEGVHSEATVLAPATSAEHERADILKLLTDAEHLAKENEKQAAVAKIEHAIAEINADTHISPDDKRKLISHR